MNITSLSPTVTATAAPEAGRSFNELGQDEFFRLLTVQMQQQDPFNPVDNNEMLAQMAQFTSLSGITDINSTLQEISSKFDTLEDSLEENADLSAEILENQEEQSSETEA